MTEPQTAGVLPETKQEFEISLEDLYPVAGLISVMTYLLLG